MARRDIAVIIPHLGLYGGNLRYIELGNALAARGVDFTIATPEATRPDYLEYRGRVATFEELRDDPPEILLASEQRIFPEFLEFPSGRRYAPASVEHRCAVTRSTWLPVSRTGTGTGASSTCATLTLRVVRRAGAGQRRIHEIANMQLLDCITYGTNGEFTWKKRARAGSRSGSS